jgi:hypothetical protein
MKIKIFTDVISRNQFGDTCLISAADLFNDWVQKYSPKVTNVSHSASFGDYTWVSGQSRGSFDHEKRQHLFISIMATYL